jgi:hypothetical protein
MARTGPFYAWRGAGGGTLCHPIGRRRRPVTQEIAGPNPVGSVRDGGVKPAPPSAFLGPDGTG